jgi:hypothetical protein
MPAARRKSAQKPHNAQPTLSFNSKPTRVTKPTTPDTSTKKSSKIEPALVEAITEHAPTSEVALREQVKTEAAKPKDEAALRAEKVTDAQIKKYWKKEEDVRRAPRGVVPASYCINLRLTSLGSQFINKISASTRKSYGTLISAHSMVLVSGSPESRDGGEQTGSV